MSSGSGGALSRPRPSTSELQIQLAAVAQQWSLLSIADVIQQTSQARASIDTNAADRLAARRVLSAHTKASSARMLQNRDLVQLRAITACLFGGARR
jgi:hypothetical protein